MVILLLGGYIVRGKDPYNFTDRTDSKKGMTAIVMSVISFLWILVLIIRAVKFPLSVRQGLMGIYAFILALGAFILAVTSFRDETTKAGYKIIGTITSCLVLLFCMALVFFGL